MLKGKRILNLAYSSKFKSPAFIIAEGERYVGLYYEDETRLVVNKSDIEIIKRYDEVEDKITEKGSFDVISAAEL